LYDNRNFNIHVPIKHASASVIYFTNYPTCFGVSWQ